MNIKLLAVNHSKNDVEASTWEFISLSISASEALGVEPFCEPFAGMIHHYSWVTHD